MAEERGGLPMLSFADVRAFERWLADQPADSAGLWVKLAKKNAGKPALTKAQAIDAALCYGWIDGQLGTYDETHWLVRFTPRKARSKWSEVNRTRASKLIEKGRTQPSGLAQVEGAKGDGRWDRAYAPASSAEVPSDLQEALDRNPKAAAFFATLRGANRYAILYRISVVKKPETRAKKIAGFVSMLERGETIRG